MREIWRGEHGGYPYWHDEGGNTVRIAPSSDGGINVWVTEQAWRIVAGKPGHRGNRFRENNGALEVLGGDGVNDWLPSRWRSLDELRADGYTLTEVPAVPPAEPGVGA